MCQQESEDLSQALEALLERFEQINHLATSDLEKIRAILREIETMTKPELAEVLSGQSLPQSTENAS